MIEQVGQEYGGDEDHPESSVKLVSYIINLKTMAERAAAMADTNFTSEPSCRLYLMPHSFLLPQPGSKYSSNEINYRLLLMTY